MEDAQEEPQEENVVAQEATLFAEKDEFMMVLKQLADPDSAHESEGEALLGRLTKILERYQEQSTLLDPHLDEMMAVITGRARVLLPELPLPPPPGAAAAADAGPTPPPVSPGAMAVTAPCRQELPLQLHQLFRVIYELCRCRGCKTIVKLFPHEAADLEAVLNAALSQVCARNPPGALVSATSRTAWQCHELLSQNFGCAHAGWFCRRFRLDLVRSSSRRLRRVTAGVLRGTWPLLGAARFLLSRPGVSRSGVPS